MNLSGCQVRLEAVVHDREDNMAWRAKMEVDKQGDMDRMRNTIDEMDRKIKDLEFENLRNRRY